MGAAASIEGKHWGREVSPSQIHKSEMSFDRTGQERKGSPFFDILIHEMRFDAIWHAQSELPEFQEEDLGKELREINKEDTLRYCEEFSHHRYGKRVWDVIPKVQPSKLHIYEYLSSYPCDEALQDRVGFLMRLLSLFLPPERQIRRFQEPHFTLLDLAKLLHEFEISCNGNQSEFNRNRYLMLGLSLMVQMKHGNFFHEETLRLNLEEILERQYSSKPIDDLLEKLEDYKIDTHKMSRLIVTMLRKFKEPSDENTKPDWSINDGGAALSRQQELMLPRPRQ